MTTAKTIVAEAEIRNSLASLLDRDIGVAAVGSMVSSAKGTRRPDSGWWSFIGGYSFGSVRFHIANVRLLDLPIALGLAFVAVVTEVPLGADEELAEHRSDLCNIVASAPYLVFQESREMVRNARHS